jgi:hypothetical protein
MELRLCQSINLEGGCYSGGRWNLFMARASIKKLKSGEKATMGVEGDFYGLITLKIY